MTAQAILELGTTPLQATFLPPCHYCFKPIGARPCRLMFPPDKDRLVCAACYRLYSTLARMIIDGAFRVAL